MAPILKVDPDTGESLDKAKTPEQIFAENAANEKFYNERKKRVKSGKKKKKQEVKEDPIIVVNPFLAKNTDPIISEMLEPFNELLHKIEKFLKKESKKYTLLKETNKDPNLKIVLKRPKGPVKIKYNSDYTTNVHIPNGIESFEPTITGVPLNEDIFQLNPEAITFKKNVVVYRIFFSALDVKQMLNHPKESQKVLLDLIKSSYEHIVYIKFLSTGNKYTGTTVASLKIPGQNDKYALNFKDEYLELRLWSDVSEIL